VLQTQTNQAGQVNFDEISYDKAGTYTYSIHEVKGNAPGVTYDNKALKVTVKVTDKGGKLEAESLYDGGAEFNNHYKKFGKPNNKPSNKPNTSQNTLPQTGEVRMNFNELIGLLVLSTVSVSWLNRKKRSE
ncbi:Spy0128 family protein, partial [Vagococcus martis]